MLNYEHIGFGELTAHHCVIYDSDELAGIASGEKGIGSIKPLIELDLEDNDAVPFGLISLSSPGEEESTEFCVGENGTTHNALIHQALKLMQNDTAECAVRKHLSVSYSGRIWHNSKVVILKDYSNYEHDILVIRVMLLMMFIDISEYQLLCWRKNPLLADKDYGDIIAYNVTDLCLVNTDETD